MTSSAEARPRPWQVPLGRRACKVTTADVRGSGLSARIAQHVTAAMGTMYTFYALAAAMGGWLLWQGWIAHKPFDPYRFAFLLFLGNIVQLLLMPLIMVGRNVQTAHAEARAEADFDVNVKAEQEIEKLLEGLRQVDERTLEIVRRLAESTLPASRRGIRAAQAAAAARAAPILHYVNMLISPRDAVAG